MIAPTTPFDDQALRWSVERRLAFIETRLTWEGRINRLDLVSRFGISPNQATADLKRFEAGNPGALVYDTRVRTYRAGPGLALATASMASDLLRDLRLIAEGVQAPEEGALAAPPPTEVAEPPVRVAAPDLLEVVVAAIRERREMSADYQSFSSPWSSTAFAGTPGRWISRRIAFAISSWGGCRAPNWARPRGVRPPMIETGTNDWS
jgi:hypothetical protein